LIDLICVERDFAIREAAKAMAVVYATNALPLKAQLIAHELEADFLEDLAADKAAFQSKSAGDRFGVRSRLVGIAAFQNADKPAHSKSRHPAHPAECL
jgi:hypothetical protein